MAIVSQSVRGQIRVGASEPLYVAHSTWSITDFLKLTTAEPVVKAEGDKTVVFPEYFVLTKVGATAIAVASNSRLQLIWNGSTTPLSSVIPLNLASTGATNPAFRHIGVDDANTLYTASNFNKDLEVQTTGDALTGGADTVISLTVYYRVLRVM